MAQVSDVHDMEVIVASKGNSFLLQWLHYIIEQFYEKDYSTSKFWQIAKMRYIHHVTGPKCLHRFLGLRRNRHLKDGISDILCNNFAMADELSPEEIREIDVVSYPSNSYYSHRDAFTIRAGDGQAALSVVDSRIRGQRLLSTQGSEANGCCRLRYLRKRPMLSEEEAPVERDHSNPQEPN